MDIMTLYGHNDVVCCCDLQYYCMHNETQEQWLRVDMLVVLLHSFIIEYCQRIE